MTRNLLPFRRRPKPHLRFWPDEDRVTIRGTAVDTLRWLGRLRPFILGGILLSVWPAMDPALIEPPRFLSSNPERIDESFSRCGRGRSHACVIDGDTFKLGQRKIRIIGIDAPELHARCPKEAQLAEAATAKLQALLNQGPFEMTGRFDDMRDRYGRDLRLIERRRPDGSTQSIAEEMRASGLAHRYLGFKTGWCD
jgi:endonuclease YncB( thermonuclease family)